MTLYLKVGGYSSATCTVRVSGRQMRPVEYNTFVIAHEDELTIEGYLYADGPAALSTAMSTLQAYARAGNVDVGLMSTVTGATAHYLPMLGSLGGVKIDLKFADTPLHMATEVKFILTAVATYSNGYETRNTVLLEETVSITGSGGPDIVLAPQAGAMSIYQTVSDYTDVQVVQSGRIVGRNSFPSLPAPLIATAGARSAKLDRDQTSYVTRGTAIMLRARDYSYTFNLPTSPGAMVPTALT